MSKLTGMSFQIVMEPMPKRRIAWLGKGRILLNQRYRGPALIHGRIYVKNLYEKEKGVITWTFL